MKKSAKRIFAGAMAAAMMLSLTACGGGSSTETTAAATTAAAGTETAAPAGDQEKVVKIAYIFQTRVPLEHSMRDLPADVGQFWRIHMRT